MRHLDQVAALLFSEDGRAKADKLLSSLVVESDARGGAVLGIKNDKPVLFAGLDLPLAVLTQIEKGWVGISRELKEGDPVTLKALTLAPLLDEEGLVGALVLESPRAFDFKDAQMLLGLLARAVSQPLAPSVASASLDLPAHEMEKRKLVDTLQRNQWNVAMVSRKLGVTRRTIYLRMEKFGIDRLRVPKVLKRAPAS
jgi:transcriptional regulator of acetoin/glycerol metabolism